LGKLKIRCIYEKNGCKEILLLDNLDNHQNKCRFYKNECQKCFCDQSLNHDCIKSLLDSKEKLLQSNKNLEKELILATDKISSIRLDIENYLQLSQESSNVGEPNIAKLSKKVCNDLRK
jgi:hypothetical protein